MADVSFPNLQKIDWKDITSFKHNYIVLSPAFHKEYKRMSFEVLRKIIESEGIDVKEN